MQKILLVCLIALIIVFDFQLHKGKGGGADNTLVKNQVKHQIIVNKELEDRNAMMILTITGLKGSVAAMEARSRNELNVVKPGEILVKLPNQAVFNNIEGGK